ncbi:phospholipase A2 inhibitor and Ly6/PLAUR domain-containing protein-like [Sceloporus undulatus]|uniref:phospholipase A2 inhibitor and Ly6/PLAUR domain-containing protein-like n=1 Tax=Sceloporus undulatus TaxID=8520 RepID=UPI001C4BFFCC|nr:phospholipase A2 inhibitor and Ly6/PLAUR domain-containing protein-like [Sceloporus undulatus]
MQFLFGSIICLLLAASGNALVCEVCSSIGTSCTGSLQICEADEDTCVIVVSENSLAGDIIHTIAKSCTNSSLCKQEPKYMNLGQGKIIRSSMICCVGDACRTAVPQIPPIIQTNGKQCPACYALSDSGCNDRERVNCVGPENSCLDLAMTITYGTHVLNTFQRGCVSKSACDELKTGETEMQGVRTVVKKAECKAPSSSS